MLVLIQMIQLMTVIQKKIYNKGVINYGKYC